MIAIPPRDDSARQSLFTLPSKDNWLWEPLKIFIECQHPRYSSESVLIEIPEFALFESIDASWSIVATKDKELPSPLELESKIVLYADFFSEEIYLGSRWCSEKAAHRWDDIYPEIDRIAHESYSRFYGGLFGLHRDLLILFADK